MAEIDGGSLHFTSTMDNDQINSAVNETLRRIQGLSDGTVAGGKKMDATFEATAQSIRSALSQIGAACETHEVALQDLENKYQELGQKASVAFMAGRDDEYNAIMEQQSAVKGEISVREQLLSELREQSNALEEASAKQEENRRAAVANEQTQTSMRSRIRELREEMMLLSDQGIDQNSDAYKRLVEELGRLQDIQDDVTQQGRILANDQSTFQGVISGLQGLAGGFSAVTGAVSLFAGENEDLQKVMTKVQSVMAITMGIQQVSESLNKDSAFQLVTLTKLKGWWAGVVAKATVAEVANTAAKVANTTATGVATGAQVANTVATGAQATAATAGTVANIGLAGAFRLVGTAIKSIPVFGWVIAGISALVGVIATFTSGARKAKKEQEEFSNALIESCYKPVGSIELLSAKYSALGDDIEAKKQFIIEHQKDFDELGVAVRDVADAQNLLIANKEAFIQAQIEKATAMAYQEQVMEKVRKKMKLEKELAGMSETDTRYSQGGIAYEVKNPAYARKSDELKSLNEDIKKGWQLIIDTEAKAYKILKDAEIDAIDEYKEGTIAWYEKIISEKNEKLKNALPGSDDFNETKKSIESYQKELDKITGRQSNADGGSGSGKDPFIERIEKQKQEYARYIKWVNSGDETISKAANEEFASLLQEGATYIDYLKRQRDTILSIDVEDRTKSQSEQLRTLNNQIAGETDDAEKNALAKQKQETDQLLEEYSSYLDKKLKMEMQYTNDIAVLEEARSRATSDADRAKIDQAIGRRTDRYNKDSKGSGDDNYDELLSTYATFEQKKQAIIDEYDEKRKTAQEHGNDQMIEMLNEAQAKAMSALASDELMGSEVWANLFGNLDELTSQQISTLVNEIDSKFDTLSGIFNPVDLNNIRSKLNEAKAVLTQGNPFKQLGISLKAIFNDAGDDSKDSANKVKKNWKSLATSTEKCFEFVTDAVNSCDFLKDAIGDVGATAIASMATCAATAIAVSTAIKTAEKSSVILAIIQAALLVCQAVANVVKSILGNEDKKIDQQIQKHADSVRDLENAYNQLSWAIDNALGGDVYKNQQAAIDNMKAQKELLKKMWEGEMAKKETDWDKVDDYKEQYAEMERKIQDMYDEISNDILQTDAKTFADDLSDALVQAFGKGEDAAQAFEQTVNDVLKNAIINQLKKRFLETQLQGALNSLEKSMGYWNGDEFVFDGLTEAEIAAFQNQVAGITEQFNQAMQAYSEVFKGIVPEEEDSSLTGAVKGVTEQTASLVAGQMNAIRINQMESTDILRQQLLAMDTIARNTSYNRYLERIDSKLDRITNSGDPLRSRGLS